MEFLLSQTRQELAWDWQVFAYIQEQHGSGT